MVTRLLLFSVLKIKTQLLDKMVSCLIEGLKEFFIYREKIVLPPDDEVVGR